MKPHQTVHFAYFLLAGIGLSSLSSCTMLGSNQQPGSNQQSTPESSIATPSESPASTPSSASSTESIRPDTRVIPMTIEGKVLEVELHLFDQPSLPFTTYVPTKDFQNEVSSSDQGTVAQFVFSPKGKKAETTYVQIFLPARNTSVDDMRNLLLGDQGLLKTNNWQLVDRTEIVSYPWAREKLIYQQQAGKQTFVGSIYIGDYEGRAFYALTHYPIEYVDGFEPRSAIMLESLQFKDKQS
jgi:hypothetical protein